MGPVRYSEYSLIAAHALADTSRMRLGIKGAPDRTFSLKSVQEILAVTAAGLRTTKDEIQASERLIEIGAAASLDNQFMALDVIKNFLGYESRLDETYQILEKLIDSGYEGLSESEREYVKNDLRPFLKRMTHADEINNKVGCF